MGRALTFILFIACIASTSLAQDRLVRKANQQYELLAYSSAADLFTRLIGSEYDNPELKSKLADCHFQMGNMQDAEYVYSQIVLLQDVKSKDIFQYAQSLKENGRYSESDKWMMKFCEMEPQDSRGIEYIANKQYLELIRAEEPFFSVKKTFLNSEQDDFGGYSKDGVLYFITGRKEDKFVKRRYKWNDQPFLSIYEFDLQSTNMLEKPVFSRNSANRKYHEGPLCFSPDGNYVYFTQNKLEGLRGRYLDQENISHLSLYRANIAADGSWGEQVNLSLNSVHYSVGHPSITSDGKWLYFVSDMPGGFGGADIYKVSLENNEISGEPINLGPEVNTEGQEVFPWIVDNGTLYFSSDGHVGLGGLDVYVAFEGESGIFANRINLGMPVNSPKDDFCLTLEENMKNGYVSSNRDDGMGGDDIYAISELREVRPPGLVLNGIVLDSRSKQIIPSSKVELLDADGAVISTQTVGENGKYSFPVKLKMKYSLAVSKEDYFGSTENVSTEYVSDTTRIIKKDLMMEKDPGFSILVKVVDVKTKDLITNVSMTITDNLTNIASDRMSKNGTELLPLEGKRLNDRVSFNFNLSHERYIPKTTTHNISLDEAGQYEVVIEMTEKVKDLKDLISLENINFDLGSWRIRRDAAVELDKVVAIMKEYPKMVIELRAHTDCRGTKSSNLRLSDKRAKSSADYIQKRIPNPERITGQGFGEEELLNGCECEGSVRSYCSEEEHSKNRRTEFRIISFD